MIPTIKNLFNFIVVCMIFSSMFENGRTEEVFNCRSEFIPSRSTESVNMTCCSNIKLGHNKIFWRKYDEALGVCMQDLSKIQGYICYSSGTSVDHRDHYQIETCGSNCFSFGIVQLREADYGEYYITLSNILSAKKLVLNFTTLATDIKHAITPLSTSTEPDAILLQYQCNVHTLINIPLIATKRV